MHHIFRLQKCSVSIEEGTYGPFGTNNVAACCATMGCLRLSGQLSQGGILKLLMLTQIQISFLVVATVSTGLMLLTFVCASFWFTKVTLQPNETLNYEGMNDKQIPIAVTAADQSGLQGNG